MATADIPSMRSKTTIPGSTVPMSQDDLQLVKCSNPKLPQPPQLRQKKAATPIPVEDSDERGEEDSSSSSSCDSSDSSDDECATPTTSSVMVMNEKSHVVHIL